MPVFTRFRQPPQTTAAGIEAGASAPEPGETTPGPGAALAEEKTPASGGGQEAEAEAGTEREARVGAETEASTAPRAGTGAEPGTEAKIEAGAETGAQPENAAEIEPETGTGTGTEMESEAKSGTQAQAEAEIESSAKTQPETGIQAEAETGAEAEIEPSAKTQPEAEPGAQPEAEPGAEGEEGTGPDARPESTPANPAAPHPTLRSRLTHWLTWRTRHPVAARLLSWAVTALAAALVLGALLLPNTLYALRPNRFTRIPAEAIIGAVVMLGLPRRPRLVAGVLYGTGLSVLTLVNLLDMGFNEYLGRGFNVALDWGLLDDAQSYVADTMGGAVATGAAVGAVVLVLLLTALMVWATLRLSDLLVRHRSRATRGALVAGTVWITCTALGLQLAGLPIASDRAAGALKIHAKRTVDSLRDEAAFAKEAKADTFGNTPPAQLVPDLRGKDMVFAFVESYGRSAIEDPVMAPGVNRTLDTRTKALAKAGFHARSGWLTSATYGGSSWLGHSSFMSGLWIDNQRRYRTVTAGEHLTLSKVFQKTGAWDTVGVMPGVQKGWPEAKWYGLDRVYDAFGLGYKGPKFSWSTMPDQYALEAFERQVHGKKHDKPLMSFVILTSSHQPWAPLPKKVGWDELGDGSVFDAVQKAGNKPADVIADTTKSRQEYGKSIEYSVTSLTEWLERYGTDDTVLVFLGDHQPIARVSGNHASRDVPVSIVAKDPKILDKVANWNWTNGLKPAKNAPVWKMNTFRDRFLTAFGSTPHPSGG